MSIMNLALQIYSTVFFFFCLQAKNFKFISITCFVLNAAHTFTVLLSLWSSRSLSDFSSTAPGFTLFTVLITASSKS